MTDKKPGRRKKIDYHEHDTPQPGIFPSLSHVSSAQECTGLMYKSPASQEELESYQELSPMAIPREGGEEKRPR